MRYCRDKAPVKKKISLYIEASFLRLKQSFYTLKKKYTPTGQQLMKFSGSLAIIKEKSVFVLTASIQMHAYFNSLSVHTKVSFADTSRLQE